MRVALQVISDCKLYDQLHIPVFKIVTKTAQSNRFITKEQLVHAFRMGIRKKLLSFYEVKLLEKEAKKQGIFTLAELFDRLCSEGNPNCDMQNYKFSSSNFIMKGDEAIGFARELLEGLSIVAELFEENMCSIEQVGNLLQQMRSKDLPFGAVITKIMWFD